MCFACMDAGGFRHMEFVPTGREAMPMQSIEGDPRRLTPGAVKATAPLAKPDFIPPVHRTRAFGFCVPPALCAASCLAKTVLQQGVTPCPCIMYFVLFTQPLHVFVIPENRVYTQPRSSLFAPPHCSSCPRESAHPTTTLHELDAKENPATSSNVRGMATNSLTFW